MKVLNFDEYIVQEFMVDLQKQCVVLMGLPAAGKSTFIKREILNYIPDFKSFTVSNSDNQVRELQYLAARQHYEELEKNPKDQNEFTKTRSKFTYIKNDGSLCTHPVTWEWWSQKHNLNKFWGDFFKSYYATYFDIRAAAKVIADSLFDIKIKKSGNIVVFDTVAAKPKTLFQKIEKTKKEGFRNTIVYLEVDAELCIERDKWREEHEGRGVGADVINGYNKLMSDAYQEYLNEGSKEDGIVDRVLHFKWTQTGNSPIDGKWTLVDDHKFDIIRKIKK